MTTCNFNYDSIAASPRNPPRGSGLRQNTSYRRLLRTCLPGRISQMQGMAALNNMPCFLQWPNRTHSAIRK